MISKAGTRYPTEHDVKEVVAFAFENFARKREPYASSHRTRFVPPITPEMIVPGRAPLVIDDAKKLALYLMKCHGRNAFGPSAVLTNREVGERMGGFALETVQYNCAVAKRRLDVEQPFRQLYDECCELLALRGCKLRTKGTDDDCC